MENIYTIASTSSSTTYGNIMTVIKELITKTFPANYFKDVFVNSEIAYTNVRRRLGRNTLNEMAKLERPYMNINPQIQSPNGDLYLYDIPLTKNFDNMEYGIQKNTLFPILKNSIDHYQLNYKLNRDQIQFEVTATVDTLTQQLDLYKFMVNHFVWERPFSVKTSLESMIPREIVSMMGKISNIDIDNRNTNQVSTMLKMMNQFTQYPITYKMRNSTALDEFFMYYDAELIVNYTDLSVETVSRKNMADDYYQLTFRITCDFNLPGVFVLTGNKPRPAQVKVVLDSLNPDGSHDLIPLYTINNFYSKYSSIRNGFLLFTSTRFQTERNSKTLEDSLNIKVLFEDAYLKIIKENYINNVPMSTLFDFILVKDGVETPEWKINWNTLDMTIQNADDNATYCLLIYINNNLFNEKLSDELDRSKTDISGI